LSDLQRVKQKISEKKIAPRFLGIFALLFRLKKMMRKWCRADGKRER